MAKLDVDLVYWLMLLVGAVVACVEIVKESRISAAENQLRGRARLAQEELDILNAERWMRQMPACPDCKTDDGRRRDSEGRAILVEDGPMSLAYNYCSDIWHSAHHKGSGTYGGATSRQALIKIGQRLRKA